VVNETITETSVTVSWQSAFAGGLDQTFVVEYRTADTDWVISIITPGPNEAQVEGIVFTAKLNDLLPGKEYTIRMLARNDEGDSKYTSNTTAKTLKG
jgi:hypothetical protein